MQEELKQFQLQLINATNTKPILNEFNEYRFTHKSFLKNELSDLIGDRPVYVFSFDYLMRSTTGIGNRLSDYLTAMACSRTVGLHFVGIPIQTNHSQWMDTHVADQPFYKALPSIVVHPNPTTRMKAFKAMEKECIFNEFPHEDPREPWEKMLPYLREIVYNAVNDQMNSHKHQSLDISTFDLVKNNDIKAKISYGHGHSLPLIPDTAILFRCNDVIRGMRGYGFIDWNVYKRLIPQNTTLIYILTEPKGYNAHTEDTSTQCSIIIDSLVEYLSDIFNKTTIAVRRGHPFDSLIILTMSNLVICAASTFCFWPAVSHHGNTEVHFGHTNLIEHGAMHPLDSHFKWIRDPPPIYFSDVIPGWRKLPVAELALKAIEVLKSNVKSPSFTNK